MSEDPTPDAPGYVAGFACLIGRPNAGKSTLTNALVGDKVAITSSKPQTTRHTIRGIVTGPTSQIVLVDTPGYMPGVRQESAGVIRHGASLVHAFAEATMPRVTVILRKAFGGAYITMNSKDLGADMVFAWPRAEIGIMAAGQAVGIVHRRKLAENDAPDLAEELTSAYAAEHLTADAAAASGFVDEVIDPRETHDRLAWALTAMEGR